MISKAEEGASASSTGSQVKRRRLGDLNPGGAVNPNRISSAAP